MARPANQASGSGSTAPAKPKKTTKVKAPAQKTPATAASGVPLYSWNNGPKTHTVSQADHAMHVADPLTKDPLYASAKQQAVGMYQPQATALNSQIASQPIYYQNYINAAKAAGVASAAYSQPIIDRAGAFATNINTPTAGLDPNSPEYAKAVQAAQGLSALATFGQQNMQANQAADQTAFQGQATNAAGALPGVLQQLALQKGALGTQIAGKTAELYQGAQTQAANQAIADATLNLNTAKATATNTLGQQTLAQTAADRKAARVVTRKDTTDRIAAQTAKDQAAATKTAQKQAAKDAAAKQKNHQAIQTTTAKAEADVSDIQKAWARGATVAAPTATNPNATRKATRTELRSALGGQYGGTLVEIMERVRQGMPLTPQQVQYLKGKYGKDFRVPSHWRAPSNTASVGAAPHGGTY